MSNQGKIYNRHVNNYTPYNKIVFSASMDLFLIENYLQMTNQQLADGLKLKLTTVRTRLYSLGMKRMDLEYWTQEQIDLLIEKYKELGDTELAELFNDNWIKGKGWTKKHIEKKRRYLNLKRTDKQKEIIRIRNQKLGRWSISHYKRWFGRKRPVGEIVIWRLTEKGVKYIKTEFGYIKYARLIWMQANGEIPKGFNISHKDGNSLNCELKNLECISNVEKMQKNTIHNYPPEIKETIRAITKLKKLINEKQDNRSSQPSI